MFHDILTSRVVKERFGENNGRFLTKRKLEKHRIKRLTIKFSVSLSRQQYNIIFEKNKYFTMTVSEIVTKNYPMRKTK